ncbi:MAG TPA: serine/threonine-protein kinase, partial [Urbifossiella sp.]|nr:serine/threonine-protein kinase [Urbifossiella sp.]
MTGCPTPVQLRQLLDDGPVSPDATAVEAHVNGCPACLSALERLAADPLPAAVKAPADPSVDTFVARVLAQARAGGSGGPPPAAGDPGHHTASPLSPPVRPGELGRLGRYRVVGVLGNGGMGVVYQAVDDRLGRLIALKVMLSRFVQHPGAKARFVREARAQAAVEHDHVAPVFDVGEDGGTLFIAMPLLKGMTLAAALQANPRPAAAATARIGREVAEGLAAAHATGLVHRDIKPSNIWLEGDRRRVRILDFGLARAPRADDPADLSSWPAAPADDGAAVHTLTAAGELIGTPGYMSPEQARGGPVDSRTDLFSLGVVLYEMAAGRRPFSGPSISHVLRAVESGPVAAAAELNPDLPPVLGDLISHLLAKDPAARPASAAAVAARLKEIELGLAAAVPVAAVPLDRPRGGAPNPWAEIVDTVLSADETVPPAAAPPPPRHPARRSVAWAGTGLAVAAVFVGVALVIRGLAPPPPRGGLGVQADDPKLEIVVLQDGRVVQDRTTARDFPLPPGEYVVALADPTSRARVHPTRVTVAADERATVWVTAERPPAPRPAPGDKPGDPERATAAELLPHVRQMVLWLESGRAQFVAPGDRLPEIPFTITAIHLNENDLPAAAIDTLLLPALEKLRRVESVDG